jgi:hypothetical protein
MRVDSMNIVPSGARGRDSIRIISTRAYSDSILVLLLTHMPEGCATWPAFWTLSEKGPWPKGGEIDIIEGAHLVSFLLRPIPNYHVSTGVNLNTQNLASLHASSGCAMQPTRKQCGYGFLCFLVVIAYPCLGRRYPRTAM